jgi:hypothetical protein
MITLAPTFHNRVLRELRRAVGSLGRFEFRGGVRPLFSDDPATGEIIGHREPTDSELEGLVDGIEPDLPEGAGYWRLVDNGGVVLMQGDSADA